MIIRIPLLLNIKSHFVSNYGDIDKYNNISTFGTLWESFLLSVLGQTGWDLLDLAPLSLIAQILYIMQTILSFVSFMISAYEIPV